MKSNETVSASHIAKFYHNHIASGLGADWYFAIYSGPGQRRRYDNFYLHWYLYRGNVDASLGSRLD
jgi:hypothetical protein